jgi:hypothetical protein
VTTDREHFERQLKSIRRSALLRVETLAILVLLLKATLSIAAACELFQASDARNSLLRTAGRCSQSLRDKKSVWSLGLALAIEAGVKTASGHNDSAQTLWADAERELERSGMRMFAAAARYNR